MRDARGTKHAQIVVGYSTKVKPRDHVAIVGSALAAALIKEVFREVLKAGGYPYPFMGLEIMRGLDGLDTILFSEGSDEQLKHVLRTDRMIKEEFEVMITIRSAGNTRSLSDVDPERQVLWSRARAAMNELHDQRTTDKKHRWCATLFPTEAYAQDANMNLREFEDFVYQAIFADQDDPIKAWQALRDRQQRLVNWMKGKKSVVMRGPNIDLTLSIEGRSFINADGTFNMPSGEIFTGPVEESANGWVNFTFPAIHLGREVDDVKLLFENGRVVLATAKKNEEFLLAMLESDSGANYLGEWAIGTNDQIKQFVKSTLFDEKIGGTIHMALGRGYKITGSKNKSAIHWDMLCDMRQGGEIFVDNQLIYRSGKFLI